MRYVHLALIALLFSSGVLAEELMSSKDFLKSNLSSSGKLFKEVFDLSSDQQKKLREKAKNSSETQMTFYLARDGDKKLVKSCTIVGQMGKEGPMKVGICFNPKGVIENIAFLTFNEERGQGVKKDSFLSQFKKASTSEFAIGKDIDGVSGATWSANAVAEAVRKSTFAYNEFVHGKK